MGKNPLGTIENSRTPEQEASMRASIGTGRCPFCDPVPPNHKIVYQTEHWRIWPNPFPYPNHKFHFVLAPKAHLTRWQDLTVGAVLEQHEVKMWALRNFDLPGGGFVSRFGDNEYNAGTLTHLHEHIQVPDKTGFVIATLYKDQALLDFFKSQGKPK